MTYESYKLNFRDCGECHECCKGPLRFWAHANLVTLGKPCPFLAQCGDSKRCGIYEQRPSVCKKYQCAWSQGILDEALRPDLCRMLVSVERTNEGEQFLKLVQTGPLTESDVDLFEMSCVRLGGVRVEHVQAQQPIAVTVQIKQGEKDE